VPQHIDRATGRSSRLEVRLATEADIPRITEIYNYYVLNTPIAFDIDPASLSERLDWFRQFSTTGRHRIFVAQEYELVGYACSHQFRPKMAYDTSIETSVYCAPEATGRGIGTELYSALFDCLGDEGVKVAVAAITLPNAASIALHERFGFTQVGVMSEIGRKFGRYWDGAWYEKRLEAEGKGGWD